MQTCTVAPPDLEAVIRGIADHVLATADYGRDDRLWPTSFLVYSTNPLSVAYGACGTALFLHGRLGELPPRVRGWLLDRPLSLDDYAPGLFVGLSGIAWSFFEMGLHDRAEEAMCLACRSPLRFGDPGMFQGAAGWGLASLYLYGRTGRSLYLEHAVEAGEHLLEAAEPDGETRFWRSGEEGKVQLGYAHGASGIALFLLYLGLRTGNEAFLDAARRGVEYDWSRRVDTTTGPQWGRYEDDSIIYPYWLFGSAGVGNTLVRLHHHLGGERWLALAGEVAEAVNMKWAVLPGLMEGMAGVGELYLDLHLATGSSEALERARDLAETVSWYAVERPEGIAFPGRMLGQISTEYSMGSGGIGLFLDRLARPGPRLFLDL